MCSIIELCSDTTDKADPNWKSVDEALRRLRREEAAGVPARPQALAEVAQKAATIGLPGIAAVSSLVLSFFFLFPMMLFDNVLRKHLRNCLISAQYLWILLLKY